MEPFIDKLSAIETAASKIMESAINETKLQDKEAEEQTAQFDARLEADAEKQLETIRNDLLDNSEKALEQLKTRMEQTMLHMDQYYQRNHLKIADEIYHQMIRM